MYFPEFIESAIESKNTSVGDNNAFGDKTMELTEDLLSDRYEQVIHAISDKFGYIPTINEAETLLSKLLTETMEIERPLRSQLESLCDYTVNSTLATPEETVIVDCVLTDEIKPDVSLRIKPNFDDNNTDIVDFDENGEILKRRLINSMVQGISYLLMTATYDSDKLKEWNEKLPELYGKILALNDFLLFTKEENITDKNPMLGSHVETIIGKADEQTVIDSQGLIYPFLLQETYRGFFELFAVNGLPDEMSKAKHIINMADIIIAEAWDLRIGVPLWQRIDMTLPDRMEPSTYPYLFSSLVIKPLQEFNETIYGLLTNNQETIEWFNGVLKQVIHDKEYQLFKKEIDKLNIEQGVINDDEGDDDKIIES